MSIKKEKFQVSKYVTYKSIKHSRIFSPVFLHARRKWINAVKAIKHFVLIPELCNLPKYQSNVTVE